MAPEIQRFYLSGEKGSSWYSLEIGSPLGSGFSGEVRRAVLPGDSEVAVKLLRPPIASSILRNMLWGLAAGEPFPLEQDEKSVAHALLCWQLFAEIANRVLPENLNVRVNPPLGYYYDDDKKAYALVSFLVNGKIGQPEPRNPLLRGVKDGFNKKMAAMSTLASLAKGIGMADLSRQFQRGTLVSPANILQVNDEFVAIDVTPGLCVRWPLSPYDLKVFFDDIKHGLIDKKHFLNVDYAALEKFLTNHPELYFLKPLAKALQENSASLSKDLPEKKRRQALVWEKRGNISLAEKKMLEADSWPFYYWLARYLPILELGRKSNRDLIRALWASQKKEAGKLSPELATAIASSDRAFFQYLFLRKPVEWGKKAIEALLVNPVRIMKGDRRFMRNWLERIGVEAEAKNSEPLERIKAEGEIRDIVTLAALELFFKVGSVGLLTGLNSRLGVIAAIMEMPFLPFPLPSPAGFCRMAYLNLRSLTDLPEIARTQKDFINKLRETGKYMGERFLYSLLVSIKTFGHFVLPIKLYSAHPEQALGITRHLVDEMANKIPVFGEPSGILQQYVFDLVFNLPHSLITSITDKLRRKKV